MSKLGRNRKGKIAVILLSALACSANTSAKNFGVKNFDSPRQTLEVARGSGSNYDKLTKQILSKNQKLAMTILASIVGVTVIGLTIWGVIRNKNNEKASEIKNDKDLKENMEKVTGAIYKNNYLEETYSTWGKETFEKFNKNKKDFEHKKVESVDLYTIIDENNPNFDEIKQFIILNVSPRIFSAAKKLGKKIVPVLQIQIKQSGEMKICLYFACEDKFEDYLNGCFIVYDHGLPFDIAKSE